VVDVEAVTGSLLEAHPRQRSVEAVAEPVDGQQSDDRQERRRVGGRYPARAA
jgi:hypothetical protein